MSGGDDEELYDDRVGPEIRLLDGVSLVAVGGFVLRGLVAFGRLYWTRLGEICEAYRGRR